MKLIELFDSTESNIFRRISTLLALPWFDTEFADDLNVEYFLGHSGNKTTSVLVDRLIAADELLVDDGGHIVTDDEGDPMIADVSGGTYQENLARITSRRNGAHTMIPSNRNMILPSWRANTLSPLPI